ncbi:MAG: metallophosphoesterase [Bacilli bacterium]|nr:metallophosphoesterase [Bacilli bacterium]
MLKKGLMLLSGLCSLVLTSCAGAQHNISEYILEMGYKEDMRILQITDTHLGDKDDLEKHFKFMDITIKESNPDLIVVTGDLFTFASRTTAKRFFKFLDSYGVKWTVTYGNHDEQCYFSVDWMTGLLNNYGSNCIFKDIQDDDVQGNANFAINLKKDGKVFEQLIVMDSNRYYYGDYFGYDCFKQNQIDWYSNLVDYTKEQNGGVTVPSLLFYHIPLPEINDAYDKAKAGENGAHFVYEGQKNEKACPPDYDFHFFDKIVEKGSTTGMYFGHDHVNDFIANYKGIDFAYGIKATDRIYYKEDMMGGRTIVLKNDHSVSYENHYHTYEEVK